MILSKNSGKAFKLCRSFVCYEYIVNAEKLQIAEKRRFARELLMSLATEDLAPLRAAPAAVALPPGAAQGPGRNLRERWGCGKQAS